MRRPSPSDRGRLADERGFTMVEIMIGVALLGVAVVTMLGTLGRSTETAHYSELRNQSLDQLRIMTADFGKDARQAVRATAIAPESVTMQTYVEGALRTVTWRAVPDPNGDRFERIVDGGTPTVHVVDLTTRSVFSYFDKTDPATVNRIRLTLSTKPDPRWPGVDLETDLEMRNVP